ncbi:MAG: hypothetical protein HN348_26175 [Proteobacteria bacterium]|nr:hypothetical protein [Pseudomonadota bacterium]
MTARTRTRTGLLTLAICLPLIAVATSFPLSSDASRLRSLQQLSILVLHLTILGTYIKQIYRPDDLPRWALATMLGTGVLALAIGGLTPAVSATLTLVSGKDRLTTVLLGYSLSTIVVFVSVAAHPFARLLRTKQQIYGVSSAFLLLTGLGTALFRCEEAWLEHHQQMLLLPLPPLLFTTLFSGWVAAATSWFAYRNRDA